MPTRRPRRSRPPCEQRADGRRPRRPRRPALAEDRGRASRRRSRLSRTVHHAIDEIADDRERLAVRFHVAGQAVGQRSGRTSTVTGRPAASAPVNTGDAVGLGADDQRASARARATTIAVPDSSPPPPSGTTNVSRSGCSSSISSATVPAPAMTSRWLYAETNVVPVRANVVLRGRFGLVVRGRVDDLGAQPRRALTLGLRRGRRQMDAHADAEAARRGRERQSVIAGRRRGHDRRSTAGLLQAVRARSLRRES